MFIQDTDLFKGLSTEAVQEISKAMAQEAHNKGAVIYTRGDPATNFFILMQGSVRLTVGQGAEIDFTLTKPGEVFGWSSMVDRKAYTTTAECIMASKLAKIGKNTLDGIFEKNPAAGMTFFRRLAGAAVQRLIDSQQAYLSEGSLKGVTSYGIEQLGEMGEE